MMSTKQFAVIEEQVLVYNISLRRRWKPENDQRVITLMRDGNYVSAYF
jgi:hypothetical protein